MKINLPFLYSQFDSRWASNILGFNTQAQYNFYNYACLICSLAEIAQYYGYDETPVTINDKLKKLGQGVGFAAGSGNYIWGAFTKLFPNIKERKTETPNRLNDTQINEIKAALDNGFPVMIQLDYNPKTAANDTHYCVVTDYDSQDENNFTIADSLGGTIKSLKSYLGWLRPSCRDTIYKYVIYEGKKPMSQTNNVNVDSQTFEKLVRNSTEYDKVCAKYVPEKPTNEATFEDIQRVVNGYVSAQTKAVNELNKTKTELTVANNEIENRKEQLANEREACQRTVELKNAEIEALKKTSGDVGKLKAQYDSTITALETSLREAQKQQGITSNELAGAQSDLQVCQSKLGSDSCQKYDEASNIIIDAIKKIFALFGK